MPAFCHFKAFPALGVFLQRLYTAEEPLSLTGGPSLKCFFPCHLLIFTSSLTDVQIRKYFTMFENVNIFMLSRRLPLWRNNSAADTSLYKETGYIWRMSDVPISFSFWKLPECSFLFPLLGTDWTMCLYVITRLITTWERQRYKTSMHIHA